MFLFKRIAFAAFVVFCPCMLFTQNNLSINKTSEANFSSTNKDKGLVILLEKNKIEIVGTAAHSSEIRISKSITYKITSEQGLQRLKTVSLPETFDSSYIRHFPEARNYCDLFSELEMGYRKI
ncbi:MAG: hypothetical protein DWP98_07860 [Bacteroidetes bacterium]|nr:MAG: hypothetical protein DWP98_07860 [Bacteroidota bacterium]MBL1145881.1 hypothetical protein [Bacteroidota bacterium]MCB0801931.1 hypothetical protein [Flavobacteriales bacterium]NOG58675.1 hypothetical protein [Bacteroidota bacterium]